MKIFIFPPGSEYPLYPGLEEAHQPSLAERAVTLVTSNLTVATLPLPLLLLGMSRHHLITWVDISHSKLSNSEANACACAMCTSITKLRFLHKTIILQIVETTIYKH